MDRTNQRAVLVKPFGVYHNWDLRTLTASSIRYENKEIISRLRKIYDEVSRTRVLSFETILKPLLEAHRFSFAQGAHVTFPRHVSEDKTIREEAVIATRELDQANVEMSMRKDVFDKLVEYRDKFSVNDNLSSEHTRCLDHMIRFGRRFGLHLNENIRRRVMDIKKRVSDLQLQFSHNLAEDDEFNLLFSYNDLIGMPDSYLENLDIDPATKKYEISLKPHHYYPITRKCRNPETRRIMEVYYQSKCIPKNTKILEELLQLRQEEAKLLGYPNHAAYTQEILMAKNPRIVKNFLLDLTRKLKPLWETEKRQLLQLKREECKEYNFPYSGRLELWDYRYYLTKVEERMYIVDQEEIMEYFPLDFVTQRMIAVFEQILSLRMTVVPNAQVWNEDVTVYRVRDGSTHSLLGYIYLDLFPRDGKFGHACCVPMQPGCLDSHGKRQCSVAAMLTNFSRPKPGKPVLLDHKELEQYFHEFGHLMHIVCSKAETSMFFGTRVETDFVEAPSQMLENWVWQPDVLLFLSCHYQTGEPLPYHMIDKIIHSHRANAAAINLRQLVLAIFDQEIHSSAPGPIDTEKLYAKILKDVMGIEAIPGTNLPAANFNHLCVGYSGRYYSYLWSEVYSMDMFKSTFEQYGIFNSEIGMRYRRCILEPGGSLDAEILLQNFLGRKPSNAAFLESKGLSFL